MPSRTGLSSEQLAEYGPIGAYESWARTEDWTARTAPARAAADEKFYDAVDPNRELSPAEREKRAAAARKAHFRLASGMCWRPTLSRWTPTRVASTSRAKTRPRTRSARTWCSLGASPGTRQVFSARSGWSHWT